MALKSAEEYRQRAQRARALAARTHSERSKASYLRIAADCERLAELAAKLEREDEPDLESDCRRRARLIIPRADPKPPAGIAVPDWTAEVSVHRK